MQGKFKLNYLQDNYKNLAQQASKAWLLARSGRFGGSEMGTVLNGKRKLEKLIVSKREPKYDKNVYCAWGLTFEIVAKMKMMMDGYEIHEFGAIPCSNLPIAYSPDGVFISKIDNDLWLLEIKCPFIRNIRKDTEVKFDYQKQVQTGMHVLPCSKTLFKQFMFRRCHSWQLHRDGLFDKNFHKNWRIKCETKKWWGLLYWDDNEKLNEDFKMEVPTNIYISLVDDVNEEHKKLRTGTYMFFKCFHEDKHIIEKRPFEKTEINAVWKAYENLMLDK